MSTDQLQGVTDVLSSPAESLTSQLTKSYSGQYLWRFHKDALLSIGNLWIPSDVPRDVTQLRQLAECKVLELNEQFGKWPTFQLRLGLTPEAALLSTRRLMSSLSFAVLSNSGIKGSTLAFHVWTAALEVLRDLALCSASSPNDSDRQEFLGCTIRLLTLSACGLERRLFYSAWQAGDDQPEEASLAPEPMAAVGEEVADDDAYLKALDSVPAYDGQAVNWEVRP